jgi:hypothetical protein
MGQTSINYLAVLVAGVAYMILGALWYSPVLFGNMWMKKIGKTKEQVAADFSLLNYLWALILSLLVAYGIARIALWTNVTGIWDGIVIGLLAGVTFVFTTMGLNDIFEKRPGSLAAINIIYHIIGFVIVGLIIGVWR